MTRHSRVGIWEPEMAAQTAAQTERHMALRGQLLRLIDEDTHLGLSFQGGIDPA